MPKLGLCISPFMGLSLSRIADIAGEVEDSGLDGLFIPEGRNDGLLCCYAAARATRRLTVATWIANIFLREPALCAWAAQSIAEAAPGRFILGLGVSHRPLLENLGINVAKPRDYLREYTLNLRTLLAGLTPSQAENIPIHFAALALETVRLGAELADGLMLDICTVERVRAAAAAAKQTLTRAGRSPDKFTITTGIPLFFHPDRNRALDAAQSTLLRYARFPAYNRMFTRSGFATEMAQVVTAKASTNTASTFAAPPEDAAMISPRMVESVALIGPPAEWPARFDDLAAAGAEWLIVRPFPVADDYETSLHAAIKALAG